MTAAQMRTVTTISPTTLSRWKRLLRIFTQPNSSPSLHIRTLAQVRSEPFSELWFTAAAPVSAAPGPRGELDSDPFVRSEGVGGGPSTGGDHKQPDERTLKLGQSMAFPRPATMNGR